MRKATSRPRSQAKHACPDTSTEFRRKAGEELDDWLARASNLLLQLETDAKDFDQKLKVIEAAGKLAERFGRYAGLDKAGMAAVSPPKIVIDFGGMTLEERQQLLDQLEDPK